MVAKSKSAPDKNHLIEKYTYLIFRNSLQMLHNNNILEAEKYYLQKTTHQKFDQLYSRLKKNNLLQILQFLKGMHPE